MGSQALPLASKQKAFEGNFGFEADMHTEKHFLQDLGGGPLAKFMSTAKFKTNSFPLLGRRCNAFFTGQIQIHWPSQPTGQIGQYTGCFGGWRASGDGPARLVQPVRPAGRASPAGRSGRSGQCWLVRPVRRAGQGRSSWSGRPARFFLFWAKNTSH